MNLIAHILAIVKGHCGKGDGVKLVISAKSTAFVNQKQEITMDKELVLALFDVLIAADSALLRASGKPSEEGISLMRGVVYSAVQRQIELELTRASATTSIQTPKRFVIPGDWTFPDGKKWGDMPEGWDRAALWRERANWKQAQEQLRNAGIVTGTVTANGIQWNLEGEEG